MVWHHGRTMGTVEHYFSKTPTSKGKSEHFNATLRGNVLAFTTSAGVFSKEHIDSGSYVLIEKSFIEDGWDILDLGCGYGAVGIAIAKAYPEAKIVCSDVNERAVELTKQNAKENNVENITALTSDGYTHIKGTFDTILLNPPQTAGRELCLRLIREAKEHLKDEGMLQLVARPNKGGKTLALYMKEVFGNSDIIGKGSGFAVYRSVKFENL